jgi:hypothetical protein
MAAIHWNPIGPASPARHVTRHRWPKNSVRPGPSSGVRKQILANAHDRALETSESASMSLPQCQNPLAHPILCIAFDEIGLRG